MTPKGYREGVPSLGEWDGLWRHSRADPPVTIEECRQATDSLWSHLEKDYRVGSGDWDDCFLWGDFHGDRSIVLEIVYPPALNETLFLTLMHWLKNQPEKWRIIIPTLTAKREAFIIYPEGVTCNNFVAMPSTELCREKATAMLSLEKYAHARERAAEEGWPIPPASDFKKSRGRKCAGGS